MEKLKKVIIAGGRDFNDYKHLETICDHLMEHQWQKFEIVSGKVIGADTLGEQFAKNRGIPIKEFPANWDKYGKSAGYKRNAQMAEYADILIAFWDGKSKGTKHMLDLASKKGLEIMLFPYNNKN